MTGQLNKPIRAASYARYSSDLQRPTSIRDQFALSESVIEREGFQPCERFSDEAMSGEAFEDRPGLVAMLKAAKAGCFDVLVIEAIDRLSRKQADLFAIKDILSFHKVRLYTAHEGFQDEAGIGVRALLAELHNVQLSQKVKRGHRGVLGEGRFINAPPYGLRVKAGERGIWEIDEEKACTIRRIFRMYADGYSPRVICQQLNAEGIPSPRGKPWNHTVMIRGSFSAGGILENEAYIGRFVFGRSNMVRDPSTRRKVHRLADPSERVVITKPELAIVPQELFSAVQRIRKQRGEKIFGPDGRTKPTFIARATDSPLSGLLRCGACGSHMVRAPKGQKKARIRCSKAANNGGCEHTRSYILEGVEARVFEAMRDQLSDGEAFSVYLEAYQAKRAELARAAKREEADLRKRLSACEGSIFRYMNALERQSLPEDLITQRLAELQVERKGLQERLAQAEESLSVPAMHPAAVERARLSMEAIQARLSDPASMAEARTELRSIIAYIDIDQVGSRDPIRLTVWSHFGRLFSPTLPAVITKMESVLSSLNGASEDSIALLQA
jgi:DNA invertase Pin-like site-specific DNA recombinase